MKNFDENELIDKAMAGRLNREEQRLWEALLAERPELEAELEIGRALRAMPNPPAVSTNFTSLVLQEVRKSADAPGGGWLGWLRLPRLAWIGGVAAVALGIGGTLVQREVEQRRVAQSLRSFTSGISAVAAKAEGARPEVVVTVLRDFEAIQRLPAEELYVDNDLLAALGE